MLKKIKKNKEKLVLIFIFLLAFFLRVYKLDEIPGELWGDVNEHIIHAKEILKRNFYLGFFGGDGPVFDYLVAIFFLIFGKNFLTIKLVTVLIGLVSIILVYIIVKKINQEKYIQYLTVFLLSTSFWHISFSRQAKPYILVLLFVELFVFFYLKRKHFISGLILGLGLFTQSSFWGMSIFSLLNWKIFFGFLPFFIFLFSKQIYPEIFLSQTSYLGEKMGYQLNFFQKNYNFWGNIFDNFQSIFLKGDVVFRHNIPQRPILDFVLTIFFIIGLMSVFFRKTILNEKERKTNLFLLLVFIFSQFASFLDLTNPQNSPAFGRMIGTSFFIYYLCSLGIFYFYKKLNSMIKEKIYLKFGLFLLLLFIFIKNFYDYFFIYPKNLPNQNVPYGKIITNDIKNEFDNFKEIIIFGCCWGEWGQPEPKSYFNYLEDKIKINYFDFSEENKLCEYIKNKKKFLIYTSNNIKINCSENFKIKKVEKDFYQKILIN